jgi:hypothetical protein
MAGSERRYDFGLRGYPDTTRRRVAGPREPRWEGNRYAAAPDPRDRRREPRTPRVTARYNRDYVAYDREFEYGARGPDNIPRDRGGWSGDPRAYVEDERGYRRPYSTIGGTRTFRGSPEPMGYGRAADPYDRDLRRR